MIYVANYIVLNSVDDDQTSNQTAVTAQLKTDFCNHIHAVYTWEATNQTDIAFTFANAIDEEFTMIPFVSDSGVFFCNDADVALTTPYTLELVSPTTGLIGNDITNDPFAFDPNTRILTASGTN